MRIRPVHAGMGHHFIELKTGHPYFPVPYTRKQRWNLAWRLKCGIRWLIVISSGWLLFGAMYSSSVCIARHSTVAFNVIATRSPDWLTCPQLNQHLSIRRPSTHATFVHLGVEDNAPGPFCVRWMARRIAAGFYHCVCNREWRTLAIHCGRRIVLQCSCRFPHSLALQAARHRFHVMLRQSESEGAGIAQAISTDAGRN